MSFTLFPKIIKFFELFIEQNSVLIETATCLNAIFSDSSNQKENFKKINELESKGNELYREIARKLASTFITPLDREDIHEINLAQEDSINSIRAISVRIGYYELKNVKPGAKELTSSIQAISEETLKMLQNLSNKKEIEENILKVKEMKNHSEMLLLVSMGEIYENIPQSIPEMTEFVIWSHIYDRIETVLENLDNLANVIEGIVLKNA
jgi:uncharacterized protein